MSDAPHQYAYEDFEPGREFRFGSYAVTAEEIIEFARQFDPQPFHLDEDAGRASLLGGLAASGWHVCAIFMRLVFDACLAGSTSQGAPGVDYVKWRKPVIAGDVLTGRSVVLERRRSKSRPAMGLVSCRYEIVNQHGELVCELANTVMFLLRNPEAA
jgi:acyl dehydratase